MLNLGEYMVNEKRVFLQIIFEFKFQSNKKRIRTRHETFNNFPDLKKEEPSSKVRFLFSPFFLNKFFSLN